MNPVRRTVEALGADYAQWRVLTRVMLKTDLRSSSAMQPAGAQGKPGRTVPWQIALVYLAYGGFFTVLAAVVPGSYLSASIVLLAVACMVALSILVDFQSVMISPNDYEILAHQPVSSRTYFLVKLTSILLYTGIIGALMGAFPTVAYLSRFGPSVAMGWVAALAGTVVWTSLAMVFAYALILRVVSPRRLPRVLGYLQLLMTMAIFVPVLLDYNLESALLGASDPPAAMLLLPSTWFANAVPLAAGQWSVTGALFVLAAFASIGALTHFVGRRLSLSYAERLGAIMGAGRPGRRRRAGRGSPTRWFPDELKVVSTLVRAQFRNDMNFRLGVLSMLPVTFLYIFMSLDDGGLANPFGGPGVATRGLGLLHFAVLGMPLVLMEHLFRSESFRASWIFFSTPVDRARLIVNVGNSVTIFFLVPYLAALAAVFAWAFGDFRHAVGHTFVLGLISYIGIQTLLLAVPRLPFSEPVRKGARVGAFMGILLLAIVVAALLDLMMFVYARPSLTAATISVLVVAAVLAPAIVRRGIRGRVERLEFTG